MSDEPLSLSELRELLASIENELTLGPEQYGQLRRGLAELIALREGRCDYIDELIRLRKAAEAALECIGAVHPNAVGLKALRAALSDGTHQAGVQ